MIRVLALVALMLLTLPAPRAYGCQCLPPAAPAEALRADIVFVGVAVEVDRRGDPVVAIFDVERVYKGRVAARTVVQAGLAPLSGGGRIACGDYSFRAGARYTVFAHDADGDGAPNAGACVGKVVEGDINAAAYQLLPGLPPGAVRSTGDPLAAALLTSAALAGFALLALSLERRRAS